MISFVTALLQTVMIGIAVIGILATTTRQALAQANIRTTTPPGEYTPFEVVVETNGSYCYDPTFPIFGDVQ